jgi:multidrug resistance efflux pump
MSGPFSRSERLQESDGHLAIACLLFGALLFALWLLWFLRARVILYAVSDSATVEVDRAAHAVGSPFMGRVVASRLALNRRVQAGDILVELDADNQKLQLSEERTRWAAFGPQIGSLEHEISSEQEARGQEQLASQVALDEARAHYDEAESAVHFSEAEAKRFQQLSTAGVVSKVDAERAQANAQQRRAAADGLRLGLSRLEWQQRAEEQDRLSRVQGLRSELNRLRGLQATTAAEIQRLQGEADRRLIRAPVSGRLGEVANLRIGTVVREGESLASVVPEGELRMVARFLPRDALGRIRPGQHVRMLLEGFPWTQFGSVSGSVENIASEVHDGRIRVEASINPGTISAIPLQHGLPGTVEVELERTSPASLIMRMTGLLLARRRDAASSPSKEVAP